MIPLKTLTDEGLGLFFEIYTSPQKRKGLDKIHTSRSAFMLIKYSFRSLWTSQRRSVKILPTPWRTHHLYFCLLHAWLVGHAVHHHGAFPTQSCHGRSRNFFPIPLPDIHRLLLLQAWKGEVGVHSLVLPALSCKGWQRKEEAVMLKC